MACKNATTSEVVSEKSLNKLSLLSESISNQIFPIEFKFSKKRKTHLIAKEDISPGQTVFIEKSSCYTIKSIFLSSRCKNCGSSLENIRIKDILKQRFALATEGKSKLESESSSENEKSCNLGEVEDNEPELEKICITCKVAAYCSEKCRIEDLDVHLLECQIFKNLYDKGIPKGMNATRMRFIIRLLILKKLSQQEEFLVGGEKETPIRFIEYLPTFVEFYVGQWMKMALAESDFLSQFLPKELSFSLVELKNLCCIIAGSGIHFLNSNDWVGNMFLGLFPMSSLYFKQSCYPNCTFYGTKDGRLIFRTLGNISKGEVLSISYTNIYQSRDLRRKDLFFKKNIWCNCSRCKEPINSSKDRFLEGVTCRKCRKGVLVGIEATVIKNKDDSKENSSEDSEDDFEPYPSYKCTLCKRTEDPDYVKDILKISNNLYESSLDHFKDKSYKSSIPKFESIILKYKTSGQLSKYNEYVVNSHINLVYCYQRIGKPILALSNCRSSVALLEESGVFPENWPDLTKLRVTLGKLFIKVADDRFAKLPKSSKEIVKKYYKLATESFKQALSETIVSYGHDHIYANQLRALIEISKSSNPIYNVSNKNDPKDSVKPHKAVSKPNKQASKGYNSKPSGLVNQPPPPSASSNLNKE
ncbi:Histone-lysine N-methyltransferase Smyd1 [Smittium mucronatum]|uniref:Histone-lysine N-methyltransferase Smyd1 n=1 Tax=Smittium mucronatum TaxID=133383 RepID=A0A1R0GS67_9FUNG|nr:Histone-lysine N-methyltransferase Smyd1 [Smittium mucronatum]